MYASTVSLGIGTQRSNRRSMNAMSYYRGQSYMYDEGALRRKRLFCSLCFLSKRQTLFERHFIEMCDADQAVVLLSSILTENSGLHPMRKTILPELGAALQKLGSDAEFWVPVPNQGVFEDPSWQVPVIQACDPKRTIFKTHDYGLPVIKRLCEKTAVNIAVRDSMVQIDLKNMLEAIAEIRADQQITEASPREVDAILEDIFGEKAVQTLRWYTPRSETRTIDRSNELAKGLLVLIASIALFVATGLILGTRVLVARS